MNLTYRYRSFTDGGCDSFHRAATDVARREQTGPAGFERPELRGVDRPVVAIEGVDRVHTREYEAAIVECDCIGQPPGVRHRS